MATHCVPVVGPRQMLDSFLPLPYCPWQANYYVPSGKNRIAKKRWTEQGKKIRRKKMTQKK